ncbi:hypothetical protein KA478_03230 [Patescibacteria group bacterium]|nr:hypothetical protein [Patescibacteria group bacterium]
MRENKQHIPELFAEYLPKQVIEECQLHDYTKTVQDMHYPENADDQQAAFRRVSFDKLLSVQLASLMQKYQYQQ